MSPVFLQLIIIGHLKLYLLYSSVKYVNFRKNEPFVYTCNRYEKYIPQVGAKIIKFVIIKNITDPFVDFHKSTFNFHSEAPLSIESYFP